MRNYNHVLLKNSSGVASLALTPHQD